MQTTVSSAAPEATATGTNLSLSEAIYCYSSPRKSTLIHPIHSSMVLQSPRYNTQNEQSAHISKSAALPTCGLVESSSLGSIDIEALRQEQEELKKKRFRKPKSMPLILRKSHAFDQVLSPPPSLTNSLDRHTTPRSRKANRIPSQDSIPCMPVRRNDADRPSSKRRPAKQNETWDVLQTPKSSNVFVSRLGKGKKRSGSKALVKSALPPPSTLSLLVEKDSVLIDRLMQSSITLDSALVSINSEEDYGIDEDVNFQDLRSSKVVASQQRPFGLDKPISKPRRTVDCN